LVRTIEPRERNPWTQTYWLGAGGSDALDLIGLPEPVLVDREDGGYAARSFDLLGTAHTIRGDIGYTIHVGRLKDDERHRPELLRRYGLSVAQAGRVERAEDDLWEMAVHCFRQTRKP
jgi:hypothetical protein